jgi:hypothetical protein
MTRLQTELGELRDKINRSGNPKKDGAANRVILCCKHVRVCMCGAGLHVRVRGVMTSGVGRR